MLNREALIAHLKTMNQTQPAYVEYILPKYARLLPWFELPSYEQLKAMP